MKTNKVEILQPPLPVAALLAKPVNGSVDGMQAQINDLRDQVKRLTNMVNDLSNLIQMQTTVCTVCGKHECHEAPHIPFVYWQRYGRRGWDYFYSDNPQAADISLREFHRRKRDYYGRTNERTAMEDYMLPYQTTAFKY